MAKLFKHPIFLLVVGLLVLVEADRSTSDDGKGKGLFGFVQKTDTTKASDDDKGKLPLSLGRKKSDDASDKAADGTKCKCGDTQLKEFFDKFILLLRAYGSKELAPEIRSIAVKLSDFIMNYIAKEKPQEMDKLHNFLKNSAKVTGDAVSKVPPVRVKRDFDASK